MDFHGFSWIFMDFHSRLDLNWTVDFPWFSQLWTNGGLFRSRETRRSGQVSPHFSAKPEGFRRTSTALVRIFGAERG